MSVILFEDEQFHNIARALIAHSRQGRELACEWGYPDGWDDEGEMIGHIRAWVNDCRRANIMTWNRQYSETEPLVALSWPSGGTIWSRVELYKALRSLRYNLYDNGGTESDVVGCFERLGVVIDSLGYDIISALPEFETADTWG